MDAEPATQITSAAYFAQTSLDSAPWLAAPPSPDLNPKPTRPLAALAKYQYGWWLILAAAKGWQRLKTGDEGEHLDYFTLCLACHHSSVATFVPTDVDSKIRDHLWRYVDPKLLRKMVDISIQMRNWDLDGCSNRHLVLQTTDGPERVSGHDGEHLSVLIGSIGRLMQLNMSDEAERVADVIDNEIAREARLWHGDLTPIERGKMAMILAHNGGDIDQA